MTPGERAAAVMADQRAFVATNGPCRVEQLIAIAIREAVAEERAACARICADAARQIRQAADADEWQAKMAEDLAERIRARVTP